MEKRRQKNNKVTPWNVLLVLLCIAGCASLPKPKIPVGERTFSKPYEVVWNHTAESLPRTGEYTLEKDAEKGLIVIEKRIYGSQLFSEDSGFSWYFGKIRVNVTVGKVSDEVTRVAVRIDFVELYDATRGRLDILSSAEISREEILFTNLSTEEHYLDHIENAVNQKELTRKNP